MAIEEKVGIVESKDSAQAIRDDSEEIKSNNSRPSSSSSPGPGPAARHGRVLTKDRDIWSHNAWDNVEWDDEMRMTAQEAIEKQKSNPVPDNIKERVNGDPAGRWDVFYKQVKDKHFQDRSWLLLEFPELEEAATSQGPFVVAELGCGPGNTTFPLMSKSTNPNLFVHSLDFSKEAIDMVKANPAYDENKCIGSVWDVASPSGIPEHIQPGTVDVVVMIFVFSALHPSQWEQALLNISTMLKPGGRVVFRDYGRWDMAQLRFKGGRLLEDNLYMRGDETRVYFFEKEELSSLFEKSGFEVVVINEDRRLLLNRKRQVKMNRVWLQARFKKPE